MKLFVKLCVLALVAALAAPFFLRGPDGRPLMTVDALRADALGSVQGMLRELVLAKRGAEAALGQAPPDGEQAPLPGTTVVYRWRGPDGVWQFSSEPPPDVDAERMEIDPDVNLVQAFRAPDPEPAAPLAPAGDLTGVAGLPDPQAIREQAEAIRDASEERNATMEALRRRSEPP